MRVVVERDLRRETPFQVDVPRKRRRLYLVQEVVDGMVST